MSNDFVSLEKILGGKLERADNRVIPGVDSSTTHEVIYFLDDGNNKFRRQFRSLTNFTDPPNAASGGVNEAGCSIQTPDGSIFHAIVFHGDLAGWRKDIEEGSKGLNLLLAWIKAGQFYISDGRSFLLSECRVEFT